MRPFLSAPPRGRRVKNILRPRGPLVPLAAIGSATCVALLLTGACDGDGTRGGLGEGAGAALGPAESAARILAPLRERYPALRAVEGIEASLDPLSLGEPGEAITKVQLPATASEALRVTDATTGVGVSASLKGASDAAPHLSEGVALYAGALSGAHVLRKVLPHGAEDFVAFDTRPAKEEVRYELELSSASGVRVIPGLVEILDEQGAPRVRMRAPTYTDATGEHAATFSVEGCNVDRDPSPPWGRPFERLEGTSCELVIGFAGASYPMLLDPQWDDAGFMVVERTNHSATFLTNFTVLLVGGFDVNGVPESSAEIMCPSEICTGGSTFTLTGGSLSQARGDHTEALLPTGSVLIAGGRTAPTGNTGLSTAEVCTLPNFVCTTVAMSTGRLFHTSTILVNNKVLIAGGDGTSPSTAQVFDSATNTFGPALTMAAKRVGHAAELLTSTGQVFIAGGLGGLGAVSTAEFFDPNTNIFTPIVGSQLTSPRAFATATRLEDAVGTILITGGTNGSSVYYKTADIFIPNGAGGGSFQQQPVLMKVNRAFHRATRLKGTGKVLLTGGFDGTNLLANTEVFDQSTVAFTLDSTMNRARAFHTATQLKSGQALVTGGGRNPNTNVTNLAAAASTEILRRSKGETCSVGGECATGFCAGSGANKVCCDEECSNICSSCDVDAVNTELGHCHTVADLQPVKPVCANDAAKSGESIQTNLVCIAGEVTAGTPLGCGAYRCAGDECAKGDCANNPNICAPKVGFCAATGCKLKADLGKPCGTDIECLSGHCADGVCCNAKCDGQCEACDDKIPDPNDPNKMVAGGICNQVQGDVRTETLDNHFPTGREPCFGFGKAQCSGTCGGSRTACDYPATACDVDQCTDAATSSTVSVGKCTPDGECTHTDKACGNFKCDADKTACITTCTSTKDCAAGRICKPDGTCAVISEATCADDHTAVTAQGEPTDCGAYHCRDNACLTRCDNIDDCISPKVCDAQGACVDPPPDPAPPSGCAVSAAPGPEGGLAAGAVGLALVAAIRRAKKRNEERRSPRSGGAS
ncbi:MAG: kelch repeat-containing protein [Polyangiaceae bacterium]